MSRTVLRGGTVVDGVSDDCGPADVAIADGVVVDVGPGLDGDVEVDCTGKTVLPGLFDCHVHVVVSGFDFMGMMRSPFSYHFYEAARNLEVLLRAGITSIRDCCGADLGIKRAVEDGLIPGPRMQISITLISQTGGHGDTWFPCGHELPIVAPHPGRPGGVVDGVDAMRRTARQVLRAGADVLKVASSGGVLSPTDDPHHGHFRDDELEALVAEARAARTYVLAHAQGTDGIKAAVRAGARSIEHGFYLDDEAIELMVANGTWLVPTLAATQGVLEAARAGASLSEASVAQITEAAEAHRSGFRRAVDAGVRIAMGTDSPITPHGTNLRELGLMADAADLSVPALWRTATSSAAQLLGVDEALGSLQPGRRADVVVLDGQPDDLAGLAGRVHQVWKDGILVV